MVMAEQITDATFGSVVSNSKVPVLVDFWAPWCGPCRAMGPVLDEVAREYEGRLLVCKMNVDENPVTAQNYGVRAIPTLVLIDNGDTVEQVTGAVSKDALKRLIDPKIVNSKSS